MPVTTPKTKLMPRCDPETRGAVPSFTACFERDRFEDDDQKGKAAWSTAENR